MATFTRSISTHDIINGLALGGMDSLAVNPSLTDWVDPLSCSFKMRSNRYNVGLQWQHSYGARGLGSLSFTQANEHTTDAQAYALPPNWGYETALNSPVYSDNLANRISTLRYDLMLASQSRFSARLGGSYAGNLISYSVLQYGGYPNPYTVENTPMDPLNMHSSPLASEQGYYAEIMALPYPSLEFSAGTRFQRWGLDQSHVFSPHAGLVWKVNPKFSLLANVSKTAQLPPYLYLLVEPQNIQLKPITSRQVQIGLTEKIAGIELLLTFFCKTYHDYPVATEYPSLSMANVVDTFFQPLQWFPMTSRGSGRGLGAEFSLTTSTARRIYFRLSGSQSSMRYAALDSVWHVGNYDYPFNGTAIGGWRIGKRSLLTARYTIHTGAPYTPFLVQESNNQDRPIYDLTQVNAFRGPMYERLDMRFEHTFNMGYTKMKVYGGGDNVFNRANFYQWIMCPQYSSKLDRPPYMLHQMGFYPEGGVTWRF